MAGPIQTAIGNMLNTATGALAIGKKLSDDKEKSEAKAAEEIKKANENERQANEKKAKEAEATKAAEAKEAEATKAERKLASDTLKQEKAEAQSVATEADVRLLGGSAEAAKAYRLAQERGLASPHRLIYDEQGNPVATYAEMAEILADESLSGTVSSLLRGKNAVKNRRALLSGKTHEKRVEEAVLALGGKK